MGVEFTNEGSILIDNVVLKNSNSRKWQEKIGYVPQIIFLTDDAIKKNEALNHLSLIKQSRLSVMPIDFKSWKIIYKMGKV